MGRQVNQSQTYADKLMKLIPTEIVGAYMVLAGVIGYPAGATERVIGTAARIPDHVLRMFLIQFVFFALLALTPVYLKRVGHVTSRMQIVMTCISFVVWVYSLGGPFVVWGCYYPILGSVVLVLWGLATPLILCGPPKPKAVAVTA